MARQEEVFAQTIMDMKRAMQRRPDDSDADDVIQKPTNRGNKRKRGAKFVQEGRLDLANSVKRCRKTVNYNGYVRDIISKNSLRVDPDGDVFDDDEVDSTVELSDLDEDPYRDVRVEQLLMPLTSAGALKEHPTLSVPYTSKALDEIISSAQEMVQREQNNLWRLKHLTNGLRGDTSYMPVGAFETESDASLMQQDTENTSQAPSADHRMDVDLPSPTNGEVEVQSKQDAQDVEFDPIGKPLKNLAAAEHGAILSQEQTSFEYGVAREDHEPEQLGHVNGVEEFKPEEVVAEVTKQADEAIHGDILQVGALSTITNPDQETTSNGFNVEQQDLNETTSKDFDPDRTEEMEDAPPHPNDGDENGEEGEGEGEDGDDETQRPHRMTTRAKAAEAAPSPTLSTSSQATHPPHPFFFLPPSILPSRDLGLPPHEAAETRRIMSAYIQKQEDAVTNSWKLLNGLLKARRWRDMVLEWCVSEGHVGEMSDGEDWYDREAWGLEGELKKGSEEMEGEEENGVGVGGRKGKTRRARGAAAG